MSRAIPFCSSGGGGPPAKSSALVIKVAGTDSASNNSTMPSILAGPSNPPRQQTIYQAAKSRTEKINTQDSRKDVSRIDHKRHISYPENLARQAGKAIEKRQGQQQPGRHLQLFNVVRSFGMRGRGRSGDCGERCISAPGQGQGQNGDYEVNADGQQVCRSQAERSYHPEPPCQTAEGGAEGIDAIQQADARADASVGLRHRPNQQRQRCTHKETGHHEYSRKTNQSGRKCLSIASAATTPEESEQNPKPVQRRRELPGHKRRLPPE